MPFLVSLIFSNETSLILVLVTVASIPWYLTLNSQVLLPQAVLHVAYANRIEEKQRDSCKK